MVLMLAVAALATPLWVTDDVHASAVTAALDTLWPAHAIDVEVGPPATMDGPSLSLADDTLVLAVDGRPTRTAVAADPWTAAALCRAWLREVEVVLPTAHAERDAHPETVERRSGVWTRVALGPGRRFPPGQLAIRGSAIAGWAFGPLHVGAGVQLEPWERGMTDDRTANRVRFGGGVELGLADTFSDELGLGGYVRVGPQTSAEHVRGAATARAQPVVAVAAGLEARAVRSPVQPLARLEATAEPHAHAVTNADAVADLPTRRFGVFLLLGVATGAR